MLMTIVCYCKEKCVAQLQSIHFNENASIFNPAQSVVVKAIHSRVLFFNLFITRPQIDLFSINKQQQKIHDKRSRKNKFNPRKQLH